MQRFFIFLSGFLFCLLSLFTCLSAQADDETSATTVNPVTQETTTTSVNPDTQETTVTKVNPSTDQTTITKVNPNTGLTTTIITTPAPAPQEVVTTPQGYYNCFTIAAGWYKGVWVAEHRVCQYQGSSYEGEAWVAAHWACTKYKAAEGACTRWEWKQAHWVKTLEVY